MKRAILIQSLVLSIAFFIIVGLGSAWADSLWKPDQPSMVADRRAARVGDTLTIVISEASSTKHAVQRGASKKENGSAAAGTGFLKFVRPFGASSERASSGSGNAAQSTNLTDILTVQVTDVLPNGLLKIRGERTVQIQSDKLCVTITGLVRVEDITPENTVISTRIAELSIVNSGKGPIADTQKPGLLSRIFRLLW